MIDNTYEVIDTLIIQPYYWRPCMETAGEIALQLKDEEYKVGFYIIDANDPFEPAPWGIWPFHAKKNRKAKQLRGILESFGVRCYHQPKSAPDLNLHNIVYSKKIDAIDELREFTFDDMPIGLGVLSELISSISDPYPDMTKNDKLVKSALLSAIFAYELTKEAITKYRPREVVTFNGRFAIAHAVVCAARKLAIPVRYFEQAGSSFNSFQLTERTLFDSDYVRQVIESGWGAGEAHKIATANDFFIQQRRGKRGVKNYVKKQIVGSVPKKFAQRRIAYFSTSEDEIACLPFPNSIGKSSLFECQRDAILFLIDWVEKRNGDELVIRVHPHVSEKSSGERRFWNSLSGKGVVLIPSDSKVDSYGLIESSDVVVTYCSTVGIEATYWGRPSISLCKAEYHGFNATNEPATIKELVRLLDMELVPLDRASCLPYGYFSMINGRNYNYYNLTSFTFCDRELSMDLSIVRAFKNSAAGRSLKSWRDSILRLGR